MGVVPSVLRCDAETPIAPPRVGSNYRRLSIASAVSTFGDGVAGVAYPWLASAITRDPIQIALIGVANRLPWLLFSLPAGVLTDRFDRRKIVASMDAFRFLLTLVVCLVVFAGRAGLATPQDIGAGTVTPSPNATPLLVLLYTTSLLFGFAEVLSDNAAQTLMPGIVDRQHLETANGRLWRAEMVMNSFVGPPVGGLLIAAGFALPFFIDAGTFRALIFLIAGSFRPAGSGTASPPQQRPDRVGSPDGRRRRVSGRLSIFGIRVGRLPDGPPGCGVFPPGPFSHRPERQQGEGHRGQGCSTPSPAPRGRGQRLVTVAGIHLDDRPHADQSRIEAKLEQGGRLRYLSRSVGVDHVEDDNKVHQVQLGDARPRTAAPIPEADGFLVLTRVHDVDDDGGRSTSDHDRKLDLQAIAAQGALDGCFPEGTAQHNESHQGCQDMNHSATVQALRRAMRLLNQKPNPLRSGAHEWRVP